MKLFKKTVYPFFCLLIALGAFYGLKGDERPFILNAMAKVYFDEAYYLKTYPEVAKGGLDPFEHYITKGWREGKNPRVDFDETFYRNFHFRGYETRIGLNAVQYHMRAFFHFRTEPTYIGDMKKAIPLKNPKYYLTLATVFRDEAPYLKEWIEFYRLQGVEHFYLYNHLSKDHYKEVLAPYIKEGIVELEDVTTEPKSKKEWDNLQESVLDMVIKKIAKDVEWILLVDTDEFLYPLKADNLSSALKDYDDVACVSIPWQMFGSSQMERYTPDKLLIEELTMTNPKEDIYIKSIMKPRYVTHLGTVHFPRLQKGYAQVTENRTYFEGFKYPVSAENHQLFKLNHYWARDWTFFRERKLARVHVVGKNLSAEEKQKKIQDQINTNHRYSYQKETDILRFVPALKKRMGLNE